MRDLTATDPRADDITSPIDEALADPARADPVKPAVRMRLERLSPARGVTPDTTDPDADDLWDNVPL